MESDPLSSDILFLPTNLGMHECSFYNMDPLQWSGLSPIVNRGCGPPTIANSGFLNVQRSQNLSHSAWLSWSHFSYKLKNSISFCLTRTARSDWGTFEWLNSLDFWGLKCEYFPKWKGFEDHPIQPTSSTGQRLATESGWVASWRTQSLSLWVQTLLCCRLLLTPSVSSPTVEIL